MHLFKSQLLQEAPRHVAGPYRQSFAPRYGRRAGRRPARDNVVALAPGVASTHEAGCELLRWMADYDVAA
ncbi:MAG TPA: hypothetical protein VFF93_05790 [Luteimonas sp.]|jgi:hypothetical protein|nr:hypothetical protein [Luteimonas sp.]